MTKLLTATDLGFYASPNYPAAVWQSAGAVDDVVWVEDAVPTNATALGHLEGWNWTSSNPSPFSGTLLDRS